MPGSKFTEKKQIVAKNPKWALLPDTVFKELHENAVLCKFTLTKSKMTSIPAFVFDSPKFSSTLTYLNLSNNKLNQFPAHIKCLTRLETLDLSKNLLTEVDPDIQLCSNLRVLSLHTNKISSVPKELAQLPELQKFYLHTNKLTSLPYEYGALLTLKDFQVYGNPELQNPPRLVVLGGTEKLLRYLRQAHKNSLKKEYRDSQSGSEYSETESTTQDPTTGSRAGRRDQASRQFRKLLRNKALREMFRQYLISMHCEENLTFWEEVEQFRYKSTLLAKDNPMLLNEASRIYKVYVADDGEKQVNLPAQHRNSLLLLFEPDKVVQLEKAKADNEVMDVLSFLSSGPPGSPARAKVTQSEPCLPPKSSNTNQFSVAFTKAQKSVFSTMQNDAFRAFLRTKSFIEWQENHKEDIWMKRNRALGLLS